MFETSHINRRRVIQGMGLSLGLVSLRGFEVAAAAPAHFTHGVASGDPLSDRVILWTRVLPGDGALVTLTGRWEVAEDLQFKRVVISGETTTGPERDHTVKVDATGLQPATNYWYRFVFNGVTSAVGRTRTLPVGAVEAFSPPIPVSHAQALQLALTSPPHKGSHIHPEHIHKYNLQDASPRRYLPERYLCKH